MIKLKIAVLLKNLKVILGNWRSLTISPAQSLLLLLHVLVAFLISLSDYILIAIVLLYATSKLDATSVSISVSTFSNILGSELILSLSGMYIFFIIVVRLVLGYWSSRFYYTFLAGLSLRESGSFFEGSLHMFENEGLQLSQASRRNLVIHGASTIFIGFIGSLGVLVAEVFAVLCLLVVIVVVNITVGLTLLLFIFINLFLYYFFISRSMRKNSFTHQSLVNQLDDFYTNLSRVKSELLVHNRVYAFRVKFDELQAKFTKAISKGYFLSHLPKILVDGLFFFSLFLVVFVVSFAERNPAVAPIVIFGILATIRLLPGLIKIQTVANSLIQSKAQILVLQPELLYMSRLKQESEGNVKLLLDLKRFRNEPAVALRNVSHVYSTTSSTGLNKIDLVVGKNEFILITGPSGAGKTTLINLILGLLRPSEGVVELFGQSPNTLIESLPGFIGYVPQSPQILRNLNWVENLAIGVDPTKVDLEQIRQLLEQFLGLSQEALTNKFLFSNIGELSGGELKRLGIARALYQNPELVVFDEPLAELDIENQNIIKGLLQKLKNQTTVLCVSHDLSIAPLADKVLILDSQGLNESSRN